MASSVTQLHDWLQLIRAEFDELPDLRLTQSEVESLWELDAPMAEALLSELSSAGFLKKSAEGAYMRGDPQ
jgi:hypothetical protein